MAQEPHTYSKQDEAAAPAETVMPVPEIRPMKRTSTKLHFTDFIKDSVGPLIMTAVAYVTGHFAGRLLLKDRWIPSGGMKEHLETFRMVKDDHWNPGAAGNIMGWVAGLFAAYKLWGKTERQRLGVENIHQDIYNVSPPAELQSQLEQNTRIQEGIQKILASGPQTDTRWQRKNGVPGDSTPAGLAK